MAAHGRAWGCMGLHEVRMRAHAGHSPIKAVPAQARTLAMLSIRGMRSEYTSST
jgi:hypothetical protein